MSPSERFKHSFEEATAKEKFSMGPIIDGLTAFGDSIEALRNYFKIDSSLGVPLAKYVLLGIIRATFLIELVKTPKIETTKFEVRWSKRLSPDDPRYADYDECLEILNRLLKELKSALSEKSSKDLLELIKETRLLAYEVPIDYRKRKVKGFIHLADNFIWLFDSLPLKVVRLRRLLQDESFNPHARLINEVYEKIKVKTYLTDRVLTGDHKTNREKRWETHPASVHFALRNECMEIEYTLMNQLCHFDNFPAKLKSLLDKEGVLSPLLEPFCCPITLEPFSFLEFEKEILNPEHGKAAFQVGHLNPLKAEQDDDYEGHTAKNISWISSDGNRIQGRLSLTETRALLRRINRNYQRSGKAM
jgi:hypothetical protein